MWQTRMACGRAVLFVTVLAFAYNGGEVAAADLIEVEEGDNVELLDYIMGEQKSFIQVKEGTDWATGDEVTKDTTCPVPDEECKQSEIAAKMDFSTEIRMKKAQEVNELEQAYKANQTLIAKNKTEEIAEYRARYARMLKEEKVKIMWPYLMEAGDYIAQEYQKANALKETQILIAQMKNDADDLRVTNLQMIASDLAQKSNSTSKQITQDYIDTVMHQFQNPPKKDEMDRTSLIQEAESFQPASLGKVNLDQHFDDEHMEPEDRAQHRENIMVLVRGAWDALKTGQPLDGFTNPPPMVEPEVSPMPEEPALASPHQDSYTQELKLERAAQLEAEAAEKGAGDASLKVIGKDKAEALALESGAEKEQALNTVVTIVMAVVKQKEVPAAAESPLKTKIALAAAMKSGPDKEAALEKVINAAEKTVVNREKIKKDKEILEERRKQTLMKPAGPEKTAELNELAQMSVVINNKETAQMEALVIQEKKDEAEALKSGPEKIEALGAVLDVAMQSVTNSPAIKVTPAVLTEKKDALATMPASPKKEALKAEIVEIEETKATLVTLTQKKDLIADMSPAESEEAIKELIEQADAVVKKSAAKPVFGKAQGGGTVMGAILRRGTVKVEAARCYYNLRKQTKGREGSWAVNIRLDAKRRARNWLMDNQNNTVARFRTLLRNRMDMNATVIHDNVAKHLLENGLSPEAPRSVDGEMEYRKWQQVYSQFNVTDAWFSKLTQKMLTSVDEAVRTPLYIAYRPLAAYEAARDAKESCVVEATAAVEERIAKMKAEMEAVDEGEKKAEKMMASQLGATDGVAEKIVDLMKKIQEKVVKKGTTKMKTDYANALLAYEDATAKMEIKPEPAGAMAEVVQASNEMTKQIDIASTTWADPDGGMIMQWKLAIEELKNPPPPPGKFNP